MNRVALISLGLVGTGAALYLAGVFDDLPVIGAGPAEGEMPQGPSSLDLAVNLLDPFAWDLTSFYTEDNAMSDTNVQAFLKVIRHAEGTSGSNGYNKIFTTAGGPNTFSNMADHPRVAKQFKNKAGKVFWTTAAGAYQFMARSQLPSGKFTSVDTWGRLKAKLGLADFSPASQDAAAIELVKEAGALADVKAGRFDQAISKCSSTWASLPGAGYDQPEKNIADLRRIYASAGGSITTA